MKRDNSSYTVTNPDLFLTDDGVSVLITSTNDEFISDVKGIFEKHIAHSIVFNVQSSLSVETSIPWMWYVSRAVDIMIVDLDTCAWIDVCTALTKEQDDNHVVLFISSKNKKRDAVQLLNATSYHFVLHSLEELNVYIEAEMNPSIKL